MPALTRRRSTEALLNWRMRSTLWGDVCKYNADPRACTRQWDCQQMIRVSDRTFLLPAAGQSKGETANRLCPSISLGAALRHNVCVTPRTHLRGGRTLPVPFELHRGDPLPGDTEMHRSRINGLLIDCKTDDIDAAARFWAEALGRPVDPNHPGSRGNYRMLETPPDELSVQIQRVDHESRVHIDIETDDIPAEVARRAKLGATVVNQLARWVVLQGPAGPR